MTLTTPNSSEFEERLVNTEGWSLRSFDLTGDDAHIVVWLVGYDALRLRLSAVL